MSGTVETVFAWIGLWTTVVFTALFMFAWWGKRIARRRS